MEVIVDGLILMVLLAFSAFFAAAEVSLLSISSVRMHSLLEKKTPGSASLYRLRSSRHKVIISLLIGNNIVNIAASALATSVALSIWGESGLGIAVGVMSFLILTFGDIAPKSFATSNGEFFMLLFSPVIEVFYYCTYPLVLVFDFLNKLIPGVYSRATGVEQFSEEEVRSAVKLGVKHNSISENERKLIENVLEFNDLPVSKAMTPKSRVVALDGKMLVAVAHRKAIENSMYSRFPVMVDGKVIGTVSVKILGRALYQHPDWHLFKIVWQPVKIRENTKASDAFSRLQRLGRNIAIVVNEKGDFAGVVTLEDLLEELVGEIDRNPSASRTY